VGGQTTERYLGGARKLEFAASARDARALILRNGMHVAVTGVAIGIVLASLAARALASQIWGVAW
jgi:hypothetical protein